MFIFGRISINHYLWTVPALAVVTIIGKILTPLFNLTNIVLIYLLPVLISAVRWGRGPSFFAAFLSILAFDFLFVPPVFSFTVSEVRDLFIFAVYLVVALVTGTMATKLRNELEKTRQWEERTLALYALSQEVAAETDLPQVLETLVKTVSETIHAQVSICILFSLELISSQGHIAWKIKYYKSHIKIKYINSKGEHSNGKRYLRA